MQIKANLGWIVAALLGGVLVGSGFQGTTTKVGVVDVAKILESSTASKKANDQLNEMKKSREELLEFLSIYQVATADQIIKLKGYARKTPLTDAEKSDQTAIKDAIMKADGTYKTLVQKATPTADEKAMLQEYGDRSRNNQKTLQAMYDEFKKEWDDAQAKQSDDVIVKARASLEEVAKAGGYTFILDRRSAPWGANDITEETLKVMNAKG